MRSPLARRPLLDPADALRGPFLAPVENKAAGNIRPLGAEKFRRGREDLHVPARVIYCARLSEKRFAVVLWV